MKTKNIKTYLTQSCVLFTFLFAASTTVAQKKHELSVHGAGGLSTLNYSLHNINNDDVNAKFGGQFGVGYTYFLNSNWGITTGAELAFYKSESDLFSAVDIHRTADDYNEVFDFIVLQRNFKEEQKATYVNVPIMAQFQAADDKGFYAAAGFKIGIPMSSKYKSEFSKIKTLAFYPDQNALYDDIEFRGIGEFEGNKTKGALNFKVAVMLSAETGMKWNVGEALSLYTGVYADYGLNDIRKDKGLSILPYNAEAPLEFKNNSILSSSYNYAGEDNRSFTGKVKPLSFGLKVRLAFGL